jgi:hypothetical protein
MFIRRLFAVALLGSMVVSLAAAEEEKRSARVPPEQVVLTLPSDGEAVEFCTALGEVKAKSGMGYGAGEESVRSTIRQRAAAMGANVVQMRPPALSGLMIMSGNGTAYRCSDEALAKQKAKAAGIARQAEELERRASEPVVCEAGADCELKWSRVIPWLQEHSTWKFRNVTDTLITTEGPMETPDPAFEVTKVPTGDGKTYRIAMRAFCGSSGCNRKRIVELRLNFRETLIKPLGADQPRAQ